MVLVALVVFVQTTESTFHFNQDEPKLAVSDEESSESEQFEEPGELEPVDLEGLSGQPIANIFSPCDEKWRKGQECDPSHYPACG